MSVSAADTERAVKLYNVPEDKAEAVVRKTDKTRANYYQFYTELKWGYAGNYNLCLNSSKLTTEQAVDVLSNYIYIIEKTI